MGSCCLRSAAAFLSLSLLCLLVPLLFVVPPTLADQTNNKNNYDDHDEASAVNSLIRCLEEQGDQPSNYPIREVIYTQQNSSFMTVLNKHANNLRYQQPTTRKPLLIVAPKHELNVPAVVVCARMHGVKIRTRSGGHDYEGLSYTAHVPFILLDMFNLKAVDINIMLEEEETESTAWVQSGATLGEIYYRIAEKSGVHGFPAGVCPSVGAGGHFSGGGYGALMRKYGLTVDNILDARLVDASGRILDREAMGEDLFWAIRGGGGSSFGVILAWKINLVPLPPVLTVFSIVKDVFTPGVDHILYKWQEISRELPKELFLRVESTVFPTPYGNNTIRASFISMFLGDAERLVGIMDERFPELGLKREDCKEMSWIDSVLFWYRFPEGTPREILLDYEIRRPAYRKIKGDFVKKPIPEAALPKIWEKIVEIGNLYMEWSPYGGRMDEIEESAVAFPHRKGNLYMIYYDISWHEDGMVDYYLTKSRDLHAFMEPYVSDSPREGLLNYVDLDLEAYGEKYFRDNFPRLVMIKTKVDPTDFFSHDQSIPTLYKYLQNKSVLRRSYDN